MSKNPEDMTMDEIKEQLAIYSRFITTSAKMMKHICKRNENLHYDTIRERRSRSMKKLTISN